MTDLKNITTQEDLENLFKDTSFLNDDCFSSLVIEGNHPIIAECSFMGSITVVDSEESGYDALFIETLVQMFKTGKLKVV